MLPHRGDEAAVNYAAEATPLIQTASMRQLGSPLLVVRWVMALAISYATLFHDSDAYSPDLKLSFVAAVLALNLISTWALRRSSGRVVRSTISLIDIASVSLAILLVENATTEFFLLFMVVLSFSAFSQGAGAAGLHSILVTAIYGGLLYMEIGEQLFQSSDLLIRLGFLSGMGFFFGVVAAEALRQRRRAQDIASQMQSVAVHARTLARDKYRLRALSEIGRLGLVGSSAAVSDVLFEISKRVQKGVGVDRCSLVVFSGDGSNTGFVAASSDDLKVEVRPIDIEQYPELQETLAHGEITELRRGEPRELWARVTEFLPNVSGFNSFLVVPIKGGERVFGAFYLRDHDAERQFDDEERDFCWASAMMTASFIRGRDLLDQLRRQSRVDGLTGLLNFQAFTDEIHGKLTAPEARARAPYTLVVADLDNLKPINDRYGHVAGNRAICEMGRRLREALPDSVAMCRYGGDEFVALVEASRDATMDRLGDLLNALTRMEWDAPFNVRASIGIAEFPANAETPDALLEAADQAMYLAKGSGGHRIRSAQADQDQSELYDAVVQVQTRRVAPHAMEEFNEQLGELQRRSILGLQAPVVQESIAALMEAVELNDPHSKRHSAQVARLSRELAQALGLTEEQVLVAEIAGHLHDVGKIKLPPEILTKTGELTDAERQIVQQAPAAGARILEALPGLRRVADIVRSCQERWDGSGYPEQLSGERIPWGAQIVGICDVYNALVSERAQRPALDGPRARRLIEQGVGREWNPQVAQVFLEMMTGRRDRGITEGNSANVSDIRAAAG